MMQPTTALNITSYFLSDNCGSYILLPVDLYPDLERKDDIPNSSNILLNYHIADQTGAS